MDEKSSALDAEITAIRDTILQGTFTVVAVTAANAQRKTEELVEALKNNRGRLQVLKADYAKAVQADGGLQAAISGKRRAIFYEIMRTYGAMEGLKNELTQRGANFDIDVNDHEHPNAAFKRITAPGPKPKSSGVMLLYLVLSVAVFFAWFLTSNEWRRIWHPGQERATSLRPGR